jgi:hypothetical protein
VGSLVQDISMKGKLPRFRILLSCIFFPAPWNLDKELYQTSKIGHLPDRYIRINGYWSKDAGCKALLEYVSLVPFGFDKGSTGLISLQFPF